MSTPTAIALAADWLCTFALHSTFALAAALLLGGALRRRAVVLQEFVLRTALLAALISSSLQTFVVGTPAVSGLSLPRTSVVDLSLSAAFPFAPLGAVPPGASELAIPPPPPPIPAMPWAMLVVATAGACAVVGLVWLWSVHRRLRGVLSRRTPETDARILRIAAEVATRAGMRQSPHLSRAGAVATPIAFGLLRPEICLPMRACELGDSSLRALLAHEIAHLRRGDPAWTWFAAALHALFPWQLLLHAARRRWTHLVELRCDAIAAEQSSATDVARCLLDVAEWLRPGAPQPALALGMAARPSSLRERVEAALLGAGGRSPWRAIGAAWSAGSLVVLTFAGPGVQSDQGGVDLPIVEVVPAIDPGEAAEDLPADSPTALEAAALAALAEQRELAVEIEQMRREFAAHPRSPAIDGIMTLLAQRMSELADTGARLRALLARSAK